MRRWSVTRPPAISPARPPASRRWSPGWARPSGRANMISTSDTAPIRRMAVLGVGLMGGSLALAARRRARVLDVRGYDEDPRALEQAFSAGVITRPCSSVAEAAAGADLVVVCAPVRGIPGLVREALSADPAPRLVTDIGSTKTAIVSRIVPCRSTPVHRWSPDLRGGDQSACGSPERTSSTAPRTSSVQRRRSRRGI